MPRTCKNCKVKFEPQYNAVQPTCTLECAIELSNKNKDKKAKKEWRKEKKERKPYTHSKEYKKSLQDEINKLARKIDGYFEFNCIDCGRFLNKQVHGAHFHNVGGNENIRYNLHNIHASTSHCNKYSSEHKVGYRQGIIDRYSDEYLELIDIELPKKYSYIGLNEIEVVEKLKIVRKLNRTFDTFKLTDGIQARDLFNNRIGIYK